jgi:5-methylcytosine-specific restriction endonuclease McrA
VRSKIFKIPEKEFIEIVENSKTQKEILEKIGIRSAGGNFTTLRRRIKELNLYDELIERTSQYCLECTHRNKYKEKIPTEQLFTENSKYSRSVLKRRIRKDKLLDYKCHICGLDNNWNGKELILVLDHINGIHNDHRLENLRFLCPNCDSQTITFRARNIVRNIEPKIKVGRLIRPKERYNCVSCGKELCGKTKHNLCAKCLSIQRRKVEWPTKEQLQELVKNNTNIAVGKLYNVSEAIVRKWKKSYKI